MMAEKRPWVKCPHDEIQFCPLYIAAHVGGFGCDDGNLGDGGCAVDRRMNYRAELERIRLGIPGLVEQADWSEALQHRDAQRGRNLRLNGIH